MNGVKAAMPHTINKRNMASIAELHSTIQSSLTLRDYLALERTMVANTRTLLSYIRTAIGVLVAGIGMLKIGELPEFCTPLGRILICSSLVPAVLGVVHFFSVRWKWQQFLNEFVLDSSERMGEE